MDSNWILLFRIAQIRVDKSRDQNIVATLTQVQVVDADASAYFLESVSQRWLAPLLREHILAHRMMDLAW